MKTTRLICIKRHVYPDVSNIPKRLLAEIKEDVRFTARMGDVCLLPHAHWNPLLLYVRSRKIEPKRRQRSRTKMYGRYIVWAAPLTHIISTVMGQLGPWSWKCRSGTFETYMPRYETNGCFETDKCFVVTYSSVRKGREWGCVRRKGKKKNWQE